MTLATVLLAGGESRRMGRDKATLRIGGIPLWQRQLALLESLSPSVLFVSARETPAWLPPEAHFIPDPIPASGPLGGLAAALAAMKTTHLLALAVDMPAMTAAHLGTLWAATAPGCGLLPCSGDHSELLPAIYPAEASTIASAQLAGPDFSLRALNRKLIASGLMKVQTIAPADASLYENCNSPADWQRHADS